MAAQEEILSQRNLDNARRRGEELAEFMALFVYFLRETPEGRAVRAEIEADWQQACQAARRDKRLVGADFSLAEWLRELQHQWCSLQKRERQATIAKPKAAKAAKKKVTRFKNLPS